MAQSVKHPTLAHDLSVCDRVRLCADSQSLEPASDFVSLFLSAPPLLILCLSKINKLKKKGSAGRMRGFSPLLKGGLLQLHFSEGWVSVLLM